jgi:SAM-dependent methyltransferase
MASAPEIAAAQAYEGLHVPALFAAWAPLVLEAAHVRAGERILDVGCGTGIVARQAAGIVGAGGYVAGVDIDAGMLTVAGSIAPSVSWTQASAERLPFQDACFDAVICQFGLMFFPNRLAALREMFRVLATDGRLAAVVWDSLERSEAYSVVVPLLERLAGSRAAGALKAPFVMGDVRELESLLRASGAANVRISTQTGTARFPSIRTMVEADLRGWLPVMGVALDDDLTEQILRAAERSLHRYVVADGGVEFESSAHIVTATK